MYPAVHSSKETCVPETYCNRCIYCTTLQKSMAKITLKNISWLFLPMKDFRK